MNKLKVPWIERDGSIFTKDTERVKLESGPQDLQIAIAFNVGDTAKHIVRLHNESLKHDQRSA
jgi:hypothetical protein